MGISYNKLWKLLIDKGANKTMLRSKGIHPVTIAKMGKGEYVELQTLEKICDILNCDIGDIMSFTKDDSSDNKDSSS